MRWNRWQDWATVLLGVGLMTTPLISQTTSTAAICAAYGMGGLIALTGIASAAMTKPSAFAWIAVVFGILTVAMPWIFQYTNETLMAWSAWIAGIGAVIASGYEVMSAPRAVPA